MKNLELYCVKKDASLLECLKNLNLGTEGIVLILDKKKLVGILTDGDLRRLILKNVNFNNSAFQYSNKKFIFSYENEPTKIKLSKLSKVIKQLPILNENRELKDLLTLNDLLLINISNPDISDNEKKYVLDALNSGWISSNGDYVNKFEKELLNYISRENKKLYLTTTSSGTSALELVLKSFNLKEGDEIIVPTITFGATANSVINVGAKPVFVDVDLTTFNLDINEIRKAITSQTKAIIIVHLYGNPVNIHKIKTLCKEHKLLLFEDAAEALGSKYKNQYCGTFGDASVFSFYANKLITTGEGGAAVFKNKKYYDIALSIKNHGMDKKRKYWHNIVGSNYRLTNIQAALGLAQMEKIDYFLKSRNIVYNIYHNFFEKSNDFIVPKIINEGVSSYWLYPILAKPSNLEIFKALLKHLKNDSIETRPIFPPLHIQDAFRNYRINDLKVSETYFSNGICLPLFNNMSKNEIERIKNSLTRFFNEIN